MASTCTAKPSQILRCPFLYEYNRRRSNMQLSFDGWGATKLKDHISNFQRKFLKENTLTEEPN